MGHQTDLTFNFVCSLVLDLGKVVFSHCGPQLTFHFCITNVCTIRFMKYPLVAKLQCKYYDTNRLWVYPNT